MLPVTVQIPAAIILVIGGAIACFAGYRFFRIVLAVYGFVLGALLATTVAGAGSTTSLVLWAIGGGLVGALVLNLAYFFGVVLVGAALGALAIIGLWPATSGDPHVLLVVACAVAGALVAWWLQKYVIVIGTALGGAWTLLVGGLALMGDEAARAAANDIWVIYPLDPAPGRMWVPIAWLTLGVAGMFVQLGKKGAKTKSVR